MSEAITSLKSEGVAMMPYSLEMQAVVEQAAEAWQEFCQLPLVEKMQLAQAESNIGYEHKDGNGPQADRKENFDVTTAGFPEQVSSEYGHDFITHAMRISRAMSHLAVDFAEQVKAEYGTTGLAELTKDSTDLIFTRFIHYFGDRQSGEEIASSHCDQSGYTFHLYETAGGCQRLDYDTRSWIDMPVEPGRMAAFPAMQLQLVSNGELRALAHRVIATDETKEIGRFAVVCFVKLKNAPQYDKDTHGRLQEFEPGFNYDLSKDDFSRLFAPAPSQPPR